SGRRAACERLIVQPTRLPLQKIGVPCAIVARRSTRVAPFLRSLITNVLFSPRVDHGPRGTSLKSTNLQSVTSVLCSPRKSRTAGDTSRPAPLFRLGFGRSLPKTYCQ